MFVWNWLVFSAFCRTIRSMLWSTSFYWHLAFKSDQIKMNNSWKVSMGEASSVEYNDSRWNLYFEILLTFWMFVWNWLVLSVVGPPAGSGPRLVLSTPLLDNLHISPLSCYCCHHNTPGCWAAVFCLPWTNIIQKPEPSSHLNFHIRVYWTGLDGG